MSNREVMQQALEALEDERYVTKYTHIVEAITALKVELEQPEQKAEPVAWAVQGITQMIRGEFAELDAKSKAKRIGGTCVAYPLYTAPPQRPWVGLTDEDRRKFAAAQYGWEDLLIAAEAKLKERNT